AARGDHQQQQSRRQDVVLLRHEKSKTLANGLNMSNKHQNNNNNNNNNNISLADGCADSAPISTGRNVCLPLDERND
ncbi:MAG: hypothetical protein N6V41_01270, partial [Candidatus Portiera aleyrodidarum]|nr:hypothetical protein [Candidatus Portiera aleyrodidarum]